MKDKQDMNKDNEGNNQSRSRLRTEDIDNFVDDLHGIEQQMPRNFIDYRPQKKQNTYSVIQTKNLEDLKQQEEPHFQTMITKPPKK